MQPIVAVGFAALTNVGPVFVAGLAILVAYVLCRGLYLRHLRGTGRQVLTGVETAADSIAIAIAGDQIARGESVGFGEILFLAAFWVVVVIAISIAYQRGRSPWRPWWSYPRRPPAES